MVARSHNHVATKATGRCHAVYCTAVGLIWALLAGCSVVPDLAVVADVDPHEWRDTTSVTLHNSDTLAQRELRIVVRSNTMLLRDTLTIRIGTTSPDSVSFDEKFTLHIPRNPKTSALRREVTIPYRTNVILSDSGAYRFTFKPTRSVQGLEAIGIHITKS